MPRARAAGRRAAPPANSQAGRRVQGRKADVAYIGACTGAKLDDLRMAAACCGAARSQRCKLMVAPASARDAEGRGERRHAEDPAGRRRRRSSAWAAASAPATAATCSARTWSAISTTARNFKGRMGAASSQVYLGSPYTVAATAVAGRDRCDPREMLQMRRPGVLGDNVDTDVLAPGALHEARHRGDRAALPGTVLPEFAAEVGPATSSSPAATSASARRASRRRRRWGTSASPR